jgi:hypothetical protein
MSLFEALPARFSAAFVFALVASVAAGAIELDVNPARVQAALKVAHGSAAARAAFHRPYLFESTDPSIDRIEVITEYRRVVLFGEDKLFRGEQMAAQNVRETQTALKEWRRRVSVMVHVTFPLQNILMAAPRTEIALAGAAGEVARIDMRNQTEYAIQSGPSNRREPQSVIGLIAEAVFDAETVGQNLRTATVRMDGKELVRLAIDFSKLE